MKNKIILFVVILAVIIAVCYKLQPEKQEVRIENTVGKEETVNSSNNEIAQENVITLTEQNFEDFIANAETAVVEFWASWCGPCKIMSPIIEEFANENPNIKVGKVNIDLQEKLAMEYNVNSIPTTIVFKNGTPVKTMIGVRNKSDIVDACK